MAANIFGLSHNITLNIRGKSVIAIFNDQHEHQNFIITSTDSILLYEPDSRIEVNSWACKTWCSPLSGCVNDKDGQFYCPISPRSLLSWSRHDSSLDDKKSIKFSAPLKQLFPYNGDVYVVYKTGFIESIAEAIQNRKVKKPQVISVNEEILEVIVSNSKAVLATATKGSESLLPDKIYSVNVAGEKPLFSLNIMNSVPEVCLIGFCMTAHYGVISLWSNGDLCQSFLTEGWSGAMASSLRLKVVCKCSSSINTGRYTRLVQASSRHIAILGKNSVKDGGIISLWDLDLFIEVASRSFKVFQSPLKCWSLFDNRSDCEDGSNGGLMLVEGPHVTVVPIVKLPERGILQLLSMQEHQGRGHQTIEIKNWGIKVDSPVQAVPSKQQPVNGIKHKLINKISLAGDQSSTTRSIIDERLRELGLVAADESLCVETLVEECLQSKSLSLVGEIIKRYKVIPEKCIVKLLTVVLAADEEAEATYGACNGDIGSKRAEDSLDSSMHVTNGSMDTDCNKGTKRLSRGPKTPNGKKSKKKTTKNSSLGEKNHIDWSECNGGSDHTGVSCHSSNDIKEEATRTYLINKLLSVPLVESSLVYELKKLNFRNALELISHLSQLVGTFDLESLQDVEHSKPSISQALMWLSSLTNAHRAGLMLEQQLNGVTVSTPDKMETMYNLIHYLQTELEVAKLSRSLLEEPDNSCRDDLTLGDRDYFIEKITCN